MIYRPLPRLFADLALAHADGSYIAVLGRLARVNVLVLDDWGLGTVTDRHRHDLLEILEDRDGTRSTVITSQLPGNAGTTIWATPPSPTPFSTGWSQAPVEHCVGLRACRNEDLDRAVAYLRASAEGRPEYRLSSFGPSLDLLLEECAGGRWEDGLDYLRTWEMAWDGPRLGQWVTAVEERRLPETDGAA